MYGVRKGMQEKLVLQNCLKKNTRYWIQSSSKASLKIAKQRKQVQNNRDNGDVTWLQRENNLYKTQKSTKQDAKWVKRFSLAQNKTEMETKMQKSAAPPWFFLHQVLSHNLLGAFLPPPVCGSVETVLGPHDERSRSWGLATNYSRHFPAAGRRPLSMETQTWL